MEDSGMVSIIMLSHNKAQFVEESVRSVLAQTYTNWELLFVDDNSEDGTINKMMEFKENDKRINVTQTAYQKGYGANRNSALKAAKGRWIAFLDAGDVWAPDKLERQILFMKENGYAFTYTQYGLMNNQSKNRGVVVSGKAHITNKDMMKCCWPAYLTVMYDSKKVGTLSVQHIKNNNDYALWLAISEKSDCHLLEENLATIRTPYGVFSRFLRTDKVKWRYEVYRTEEDLGRVTSFFYTIRNGWYGIVKWMKYVKRV